MFRQDVQARYGTFGSTELESLLKGNLGKIWEVFVQEERPIFDRICRTSLRQGPFQFADQAHPCRYLSQFKKVTMLIFRPSGVPESELWCIFEKPTRKHGTYSFLDSPTLDFRNCATRAVMEKGFTENSCFGFDVFSRRTSATHGSKTSIWSIDPEWTSAYHNLHRQYRQLGGSVVVVFGENAFLAYYAVVEMEESSLERLNPDEPCGYSVFLERSQVQS